MMRVAMITDYPDDADRLDGGVQSVARYLVEALSAHDDIELHVVVFRFGQGQSRIVEMDGFTKHVLPGARLGSITAYRKDQQILNACLEGIRPDLVHGQGAGHDGIVAKRSPYPSLITIHGMMAAEVKYQPTFGKRLRHWLTNAIGERYCVDYATDTIIISPYVAEYYGSRIAGRLHFIPNPTAPNYFDIERNEDAGRVLFAGRVTPIKGVLDLVRATARLEQNRRVKIALAGSLAERTYVDQVMNEAHALGVAEKVEFLGNLSSPSLLAEMSRASMLVLPSYQETAPMVIQEAMAAGIPVIATRVGGTQHQVIDGETGYLIDTGDVGSLAARMGSLLADPDKRHSFGQAGKIVANREYRASTVADKTIAVYRQLVS